MEEPRVMEALAVAIVIVGSAVTYALLAIHDKLNRIAYHIERLADQ